MYFSPKHLALYLSSLILLSGCATKSSQTKQIPVFDWVKSDQKIDLSWAHEVGAKSFPSGIKVSANRFGAVSDTTVLSTNAFQAAIDSCHSAGGGTVICEPGSYKTGALFIKDGVNLEVGKDVTLYGSTDINDYPEIRSRVAGIEMDWPSAVLNIIGANNAAITGEGTIDCLGNVFWEKYWEMRKEYEKEGLRWIVDYDCKRVRGILVSESTNVSLQNFTLMRTGFWGIQIVYSSHCTADGLTINNNVGGHGPSTDGIDIDSSSYVLVDNCDIDCNDDNICLKAGRDADGLRVNRPTEFVVIRNCVARKGAGLITCGSETSGGISNILGYNLKAYGTSSALRIKSALNRGGKVENVYMTNVVVDSVRNVLAADLNWNPSYSYSVLPEKYEQNEHAIPEHWVAMLTPVEPEERGYPLFRNIFLSDVEASNVQQFITVSGWSDSLRLENFQLNNIDVNAKSAGKVKYTNGFILTNIRLQTADNSEISYVNNTNLITEAK